MSFDAQWLRPGVLLCRWPDDITLDGIEASITHHDGLLAARPGMPYVPIHESQGGLPKVDAAQRRRLGQWVTAERDNHHRAIRGVAFVTNSPILRGTITAVGWIAAVGYPWKTFASRDEAIEWAAELLDKAA